MRLGSVSILPPLVLGLLPALSGCGDDSSGAAEQIGEVEHQVVSVGAPVFGPSTTAASPPGSLMFATPTSSPVADVAATSIHEARFSDGIDLSGLPNETLASWRTAAIGDGFATPPAFATRLDEALAAANAAADAVMTPTAAEAGLAELFSAFGVSVSSTVTPRFYGWKTPRARWLQRQDSTVYPDPMLFREARFRGARQYCSARNMQQQQFARGNKISMGQRALAELRIFNHTIDLMSVEPTFVLAGPQRFTNGTVADGAQSFIVPVLVGSKITPIGNIGLPSMPEVRAPFVFVSADGEVRNNAQFDIWSGFRKTFQTVTHADAVVAREAEVAAGVSGIPLFTVAVVDVEMSIEATAKLGASKSKNDRALDWNTPTPHVFGAPGRPQVPEGSVTFAKYDDSPFRVISGTPFEPRPVDPDLTTPGIQFFQRQPLAELNMGLIQTTDPMLARSIQDDDHTLDVEHAVGLNVGLQAGLGFDVGILTISIDAGGHLGVTGGQTQELRDAMIRENQQLAGFLSATPRNSAEAFYDVYAKLSFKLGPFSFEVPIFSTGPQSLARIDGPAFPEKNRARMGESAQMGSPMKQPAVSSHLPQDPAGAFPSFPPGNDVDSCLLNDAPNPETPPLCEATPPGGTRPVFDLCVEGHAPAGHPFPSNVCADPAGYVAALRASPAITPGQADCIEGMLAFVCQDASAQLDATTVSHALNLRRDTPEPEVEALAAQLQAIMMTCDAPGAFGPGASESTLFEVNVCNDKAQPFSPNQPGFVVTGTGETTPRPGTCN